MKIAIVGTHCTGKTTLIKELLKKGEFKDFQFISSSTRQSSSYGLKINEDGDDLSQLYMASCDFKNIIEARENVISDRCLLDTSIYTRYLWEKGQCKKETLDTISFLWNTVRSQYDFLFWLRPEFNLVKDGVRSVDKGFQESIDLFFNLTSREKENLIVLSGSIEEKINELLNIIKDYRDDKK